MVLPLYDEEPDEIEQWLDEIIEGINNIVQKRKFGGALVIDDAIKPDDADADIKRMRVNRRWNSTIKSRLNSRDTPVIVIMQRLHPMDLIGYLKATEGLKKDGGEWEELELSALYVNENGELESLDPSMHTVDDLIKMRDNADEEVRIAFQRQYQQNPKPREGLLFPETDLKYYDPKDIKVEELSEYTFGYVDAADKGGDDTCTIITYLVGNRIYVHDVLYNTHGTDINEPRTVDMFIKHRLKAAEIEGNGAWILYGKSIRAKVLKKHPNCQIRIFPNTTNKHTRILAQASFIRNNLVFRLDWHENSEYRKFMDVLTSYRQDQKGTNKNAHDDAPDGCAGVAYHFDSKFSHLW